MLCIVSTKFKVGDDSTFGAFSFRQLLAIGYWLLVTYLVAVVVVAMVALIMLHVVCGVVPA